MAANEPRHYLLKIPHVARIFSSQKIVADEVVEFGRLTVGISLTQEMFSQRNYIFVPLTERRQLGDETGDPIVEVSTKRATANEVAEVPIGRANQPEFASTPCAASQALVTVF